MHLDAFMLPTALTPIAVGLITFCELDDDPCANGSFDSNLFQVVSPKVAPNPLLSPTPTLYPLYYELRIIASPTKSLALTARSALASISSAV